MGRSNSTIERRFAIPPVAANLSMTTRVRPVAGRGLACRSLIDAGHHVCDEFQLDRDAGQSPETSAYHIRSRGEDALGSSAMLRTIHADGDPRLVFDIDSDPMQAVRTRNVGLFLPFCGTPTLILAAISSAGHDRARTAKLFDWPI